MTVLDARAALIVSEVDGVDDWTGLGGHAENIASLVTDWHRYRRPIVLVRLGAARPDAGGAMAGFVDCGPARAGVLVTDSFHSALHGVVGLELSRLRVRQLVLCGAFGDGGCQAAGELAAEAGYEVLIAIDATSCTRTVPDGSTVRGVRSTDLLPGTGPRPAVGLARIA